MLYTGEGSWFLTVANIAGFFFKIWQHFLHLCAKILLIFSTAFQLVPPGQAVTSRFHRWCNHLQSQHLCSSWLPLCWSVSGHLPRSSHVSLYSTPCAWSYQSCHRGKRKKHYTNYLGKNVKNNWKLELSQTRTPKFGSYCNTTSILKYFYFTVTKRRVRGTSHTNNLSFPF